MSWTKRKSLKTVAVYGITFFFPYTYIFFIEGKMLRFGFDYTVIRDVI